MVKIWRLDFGSRVWHFSLDMVRFQDYGAAFLFGDIWSELQSHEI